MANSLPIGTQLQGGKYRIDKVLGQGSFGITYSATNTLLAKQMAIKEFFMKDINTRVAEYHTSEGRIDLVIQTSKFCYVMEFKLDGTAEEALAQIRDKSYILPFEQNGQKIIRIGMNFSKESRNIERYIVE